MPLAARWCPPPLEPGKLVPGTHYRVLKRLGCGGMSSVHEVVHERLGRHFVLKALLSELAWRDDLVARVRGEWRTLARLEHPNIVRVTDAGMTVTGLPYFVMERLPGQTLAERLASPARLGLGEVLNIAVQVLRGLAAAHALGIVHRDVKPQNIFVSDGALIKLFDFGIAKYDAEVGMTTTHAGVRLGTPRYMSPEQVRGEPVDARADLYAFGLVLFEMTSGRHPFSHVRGTEALFAAHLEQTPVSLASLAPGLPSSLSRLVAELLAKQPDQRPSSALAVIHRLSRLAPNATNATNPTSAAREPSYPAASRPRPPTASMNETFETRRPVRPWTRAMVGRACPTRSAADTVIGIPWTVVGDVLIGGAQLWTNSKQPGGARRNSAPASAKPVAAAPAAVAAAAPSEPTQRPRRRAQAKRQRTRWRAMLAAFLTANSEVALLILLLLLNALALSMGLPRLK